MPLIFLAAGSILAGFPFKELFAGHHVEEFFRESLKFGAEQSHPARHARDPTGRSPCCRRVMMAIGFAIAWQFYIRRPDIAGGARAAARACSTSSCSTSGTSTSSTTSSSCARRYGSAACCGRAATAASSTASGPDGVSARVLDVTRNVVRLQTGYLYHYAFAMLIGVAALITWFMFAGGPLMSSWPILSITTFLPLLGVLFICALRGDDEAVQAQRALGGAVDHARHLRGVADPGVALRSRRRPNSSSSRSMPGSAAPPPTTWASTAFRCRS